MSLCRVVAVHAFPDDSPEDVGDASKIIKSWPRRLENPPDILCLMMFNKKFQIHKFGTWSNIHKRTISENRVPLEFPGIGNLHMFSIRDVLDETVSRKCLDLRKSLTAKWRGLLPYFSQLWRPPKSIKKLPKSRKHEEKMGKTPSKNIQKPSW